MNNINVIAVKIREQGRASGWSPVTHWDWAASLHKVPCQLALIHSEIVEAHFEFILDRMTDYDALAAEFADIAIRVLDLAGGLTKDFAKYVGNVEGTFIAEYGERVFNDFHQITTAALEEFRKGDKKNFLRYLAILLSAVNCYAAGTHSIDLDIAVSQKMEVNRHRSHKHGGKRI